MSDYGVFLEDGSANYAEMEPLYREHYAEMQARCEGQGIRLGPYAPRLDRYFAAVRAGDLLCFVVRQEGRPVGYSNIYLTNDMHNGELIAREDTIFVTRAHRKGVGRYLAKCALLELASRGVKRLHVQAVTDPRVAAVWRRMGFRPIGDAMIYQFGG